jgi:2-methylcitrate dehydratase PrpD
MSTDAIEAFCAHATGVRFEDLPPEAVAASKRFILDSIGVCVSGSRGPFAAELLEAEGAQADGTSRILGRRQSLRDAHGFDGSEVERVVARVPQLTERLVGRASDAAMGVNYARLSGPYVAAVALLRGAVTLADFEAEALADAATLHLAERVQIEVDDNPDPNALTPIEVRVWLRSGSELSASLDTVYGNPAKPMSRAAYLEKFRSNWASAAEPLASAACEEALRRLENLEAEADVSSITALAQPH